MKILPSAESYPAGRLFSLDLLRGLDIFFLTVFCCIMGAAHNGLGLFSEGAMEQLMHRWGLFHVIDLVMPLFIFMCGAAIPFALGRRLKDGRPTAAFWRHLGFRFVLLWVCGMIAQGQLLSLDWREISPFNNTLQTIACGYVIAALTMLIRVKWARWAMPALLALLYAVPMAIHGDYSQGAFEQQGGHWVATGGNLAWILEVKILDFILPAGSNVLAHRDPGYTWFATIPMFGVMTLCGMISTEILVAAGKPKVRKGVELLVFGAGLLGLGWALYPFIPSIKHVFTVTFTAQAMGWSVLLLAGCYFLSDVLMVRRGLGIFILFGQFALTAYMFADTPFWQVLDAATKTAGQGFAHLFGDGWGEFLRSLLRGAILTGILAFRYALREARAGAAAGARK